MLILQILIISYSRKKNSRDLCKKNRTGIFFVRLLKLFYVKYFQNCPSPPLYNRTIRTFSRDIIAIWQALKNNLIDVQLMAVLNNFDIFGILIKLF